MVWGGAVRVLACVVLCLPAASMWTGGASDLGITAAGCSPHLLCTCSPGMQVVDVVGDDPKSFPLALAHAGGLPCTNLYKKENRS